MFANAKVLLAFVTCALLVHAQGPSAASGAPAALPSGVDSCIVGCVSQAAASSACGTFTNVSCACTNTNFQAAARKCLTANCTQADLQTAEQMQNSECAALSSGSASGSAAPSTAASHSSTASSSPTATSSSAAMGLSAPLSFGSIVGTLVASAGVLVGATFVL